MSMYIIVEHVGTLSCITPVSIYICMYPHTIHPLVSVYSFTESKFLQPVIVRTMANAWVYYGFDRQQTTDIARLNSILRRPLELKRINSEQAVYCFPWHSNTCSALPAAVITTTRCRSDGKVPMIALKTGNNIARNTRESTRHPSGRHRQQMYTYTILRGLCPRANYTDGSLRPYSNRNCPHKKSKTS
jgi:hypothetical protein